MSSIGRSICEPIIDTLIDTPGKFFTILASLPMIAFGAVSGGMYAFFTDKHPGKPALIGAIPGIALCADNTIGTSFCT